MQQDAETVAFKNGSPTGNDMTRPFWGCHFGIGVYASPASDDSIRRNRPRLSPRRSKFTLIKHGWLRRSNFQNPVLRGIWKKTGFLRKTQVFHKNPCFDMQWSTLSSFLSWTSLPPSSRIKKLLACASLMGDLRSECQIENMELAWRPPPDFEWNMES